MKKMITLASVAILFFAACKKNDTPIDANIRLVNLSPNSNNLDLNANNALVIGGVAYGVASSYRPISSNSPLATITTAGVATPYVNANLLLQPSKFYSFFAYDSTTAFKVSLVEDDRTAPATGKINMRFLHFYKGSVIVDIKRGTTSLFTSRTTNDHSSNGTYTQYTSMDPGSYSLGVFVAGSSVNLFQLPAIDFVAGKNYTLVLRGFSSVTSGPQAMVLVPITDN
ncbi:MAG: DUF4397 domain-containing protein [Sphingobacteriia bacterium]|jgi:hypothetical protein|nr:MAG: DUF4397 domain-containing protein [Sphingobacteriia bacterium]